ncbi:hypothetical protein ICR95_25705 (plasmid) [Priestia megaterium]|uniref:Uncharacterized protein n=1 Tax=Priestia megaterium TaxID=1404 RepID=A0AAX6BT73_PRIMG|nr:hypothetical protein [Priestia megaterium]QSF35872.1 hypothetical protein ICR95_25705 [Priestia megaterium]GMG76928.1 hypothetical protein ShirakiTB12_53970 [Priestia megaterium]
MTKSPVVKSSLLLTEEADKILRSTAKIIGVSLSNIVCYVISEIFTETELTKEKIQDLKDNMKISKLVSININNILLDNIDSHNKYGLSRRIFLGLIVSEYLENNRMNLVDGVEDEGNHRIKTQIWIDSDTKKKILNYCNEYSLSINTIISLRVIKRKERIANYHSGNEKETLDTTFSQSIRNIIEERAGELSISIRFLILLIVNDFLNEKNC